MSVPRPFLADPRPWCFVLEITPTVSDTGEIEQFLFSDHAWATSATDTPANKRIRPLLSERGTLRRGLFDKGSFGSGISADYGQVVLRNTVRTRDGVGELDAWANYGVSGSPMVLRWGPVGGAYPGEFYLLWSTFASKHQVDLTSVSIWHQDIMYLLNKQVITEGFQGTGGLEGTRGVPKRKQFVSHDPGFIEPILIDPIRQIYFVQSTSSGGLHDSGFLHPDVDDITLFDVLINAVKVTRASNYTSAADLLSSPPEEGEVRYWFGVDSAYVSTWKNGPVYFRLGSPAGGDVRVFAYGAPTDSDHQLRGTPVGSFFAGAIALRAGFPVSSVDLAGDNLFVGPQIEDGNGTFADLLEDAARSYHGFYYVDRDGVFKSGFLLDPEDNDYYYGIDPSLLGSPRPLSPTTEVYTFTEKQLSNLSRQPIGGFEVPCFSVDVQAGKTWPSQIANSAEDDMRDYLSREVWSSFQGVSSTTKLMEPGAKHLSVQLRGRHFQSPGPLFWDRKLWLSRFFVLFGGRHAFYTFTLPLSPELLDINLHDVVKLVSGRFGLSAGKKFRVVRQYFDLNQPIPQVTFTVWGGTKGQYTGDALAPPAPLPPAFGRTLNPLPTVVGFLTVDNYATLSGSVVNIGQTVTGLLLQLLDPYFSSVLVLMHCEEDATGGGSPTPHWIDSSGYGQTLTACGTITATGTGALVGSKSMQAGASGKVEVSTHQRNNIGSGSVTVDIVIKIASTPSFERLFEIGGAGIQIWFKSSTLAPTVLAFGAEVFTASALSSGVQYHLRLTKSSTTYTLYADGVQIGTGTRAGADDGTTNRAITCGNQSSAGQPFVSGLIDEFRVTKGVVRDGAEIVSLPFPNG